MEIRLNKICIFICLILMFLLPFITKASDKPAWHSIDEINTKYSEFSPTISPDNSFMIFGSSRPGGQGDKDLWISYFKDKKWSKPENLRTLNSKYHDQEPFLTYDGRALLFSSDRDGGYGVGDIYISYKQGEFWSKPVNLGSSINTKDSEKMPSISMDNKEIYFARIPVNYKKQSLEHNKIHICVSEYKDNKWQKPAKLPEPVNKLKLDCAPRIMPDNKTLFFCSGRDGGIGKYDIWLVKRKARNEAWGGLTNLIAINTPQNEVYFTFTISGDRLYKSAMDKSLKNYDIYEFIVKKEILDPTVTLQGRVTNIRDGKQIEASITVELFSNTKEKFEIRSDKITGLYSVTIPSGGDYSLTVEAEGFMFYSERIDLTKLSNSSVAKKDVGLHPLRTGENIVVNTIYFDHDSYRLRDESKLALDRVVELFKQNPKLRVLIKGHVSKDMGGKLDTQGLSEQRAKAVKGYLVDHGIIAPARLKIKGYGDSQPLEANNTEKGRKMNRRTEFEILPPE